MDAAPLHEHLIAAARWRQDSLAIVEPGRGEIRYGELDALSDRLRDRLRAMGVGPGDRVGIYVRKSIDAVAAIYGILKTGAAYVPVDPTAPAARNAYIVHNCAVAALVMEEEVRRAVSRRARCTRSVAADLDHRQRGRRQGIALRARQAR